MGLELGFAISFLSFITCILIASFIGKTKYFSFILERKNRFGSIDGVRGYLAISVFFHHFVITYYWKTENKWQRPPEDLFQNFGKVGVAIFFMITGFLFFSRIIDKNKTLNWVSLYQSRLFRIYPLYLFAICNITFIVLYSSEFQINVSFLYLLKDYMKWFLFIGGPINQFSDTKNIIASVDWTLTYEWVFYFSLPLIFIVNRVIGKWGLVCIAVLSVFLFYRPIYVSYFSSAYFIYFALGSIAYYFTEKFKGAIKRKNNSMSFLSLALVVFLLVYPKTLDSIHVVVMSILFVIIASGCNMFGVFSSRGSIVLGEISYSIYLLHGIVLYLLFTIWSPLQIAEYSIEEFILFLPLVSILVVLISTITFLTIEKPAINAGKKLKFSMSLNKNTK